MTGVLTGRRSADIQGRMPRERAAVIRGIKGMRPCANESQQPPEGREDAWDRFFLSPQERTNPAGALILDSRPPELTEKLISVGLSHPVVVVCYDNTRKLIQPHIA